MTTKTEEYCEIIRQHARPLEPVATGETAQLDPIEGIRAVLFDVYGTLFISGCGDIGTTSNDISSNAFGNSLRACGVTFQGEEDMAFELMRQAIKTSHENSLANGIDSPEVDIVQIWQELLPVLEANGMVEKSPPTEFDYQKLAIEYEVRQNPVWPMPNVQECLEQLREAGLVLGIISNAQFFTPLLFDSLLGHCVDAFEFQDDLQFYSYKYGRGKPSLFKFELARDALAARGLQPKEVLYVGNDMLNDVYPAHMIGFKTALFAGDVRSLRRREEDPRVEDLTPDLIITDLAELTHCVVINRV